MSAARLTGAEGWGAIAPRPRSERPSVAGERCCKLLLESIRGVAGDDDLLRSYLTNAQGAGHGIDSGEAALGTAISARLADNESTARDVP